MRLLGNNIEKADQLLRGKAISDDKKKYDAL